MLIALSENRYRKDLSPVEEARAFNSLLKMKMKHKEIAKKAKRSITYVRSRLSLLELPTKIQKHIINGKIDFSYAASLKKLNELPEAQNALAKSIMSTSYGEISSVKGAERQVTRALEQKKKTEDLLTKYGPCPKCGSKNISESYYPDTKLTCGKCEYGWHKETKDPWEYYQLKQNAKELGFDLNLEVPGKAMLTPKEVAELIETQTKEEKISPSFRSHRSIEEVLNSLVKEGDVLDISVDGEHIHLTLIEETPLHFRAYRKPYRSGEKTKVVVEAGWQKEDTLETRMPLVKTFFKTLNLGTKSP